MNFSLHDACLTFIHSNDSYSFIYESLICGKKLTNSDMKWIVSLSGIYHLFVVSGAHINLFHQMLSYLRLPKWLQLLLTFIYVGACNFSSPSLRAFIHISYCKIDQSFKLNTPKTFIIGFSVLVTLALNPRWIFSLSLPLSGLAALCFSLPVQLLLTRNIILFLVLSPVLAMFQPLHPLTILINFLITPLWGSILFPSILLAGVITPLRVFLKPIWDSLTYVLQQTIYHSPYFYWQMSYSLVLAWSYLIILYFIFYYLQIKRRAFL